MDGQGLWGLGWEKMRVAKGGENAHPLTPHSHDLS